MGRGNHFWYEVRRGEEIRAEVIGLMKENDLLIVCELSRLGRNLMEVMSVLHECMTKNAKVFSLKEGYGLGNNINSKVLAFAFSLSAEIERNLISHGSPLRAHQRSLGSQKAGRNELRAT